MDLLSVQFFRILFEMTSYGNKGQYKEEFVTCGGIDLACINISTLEARQHSGLYFAGELLDVDGITGGFNLQAAWSMAAVVADSIAKKYA